MDNRVRNESAFKELLEEIKRRSDFETLLSDLKDHYMNTNPFYLFSNQFHELILNFKAQLETGNSANIRKCMKELIQELTFYKIACPMKHLKLADSNIPNLISSLKPQAWLMSDEKKSNSQVNKSVSVQTNNSVNTQMNKSVYEHPSKSIDGKDPKVNDVAKKNIHQVISNNNNVTNNCNATICKHNLKTSNPTDPCLRECKSAPLNGIRLLEDALKSVPNGTTAVINLDADHWNDSPSSCDKTVPSRDESKKTHDTGVSSKRKVGEITVLKEDEISRKKTSNGQNLVRIRKHSSEIAIPTVEHSNKVKETIYIMDDGDDDDVIIKSIISPADKTSSVNKNLASVPKEKAKEPITKEPKAKEPTTTPPQNPKVNSKTSGNQDDDIFIVEDVAPTKNASPPKRPHPAREEDVIFVQSYKLKPHHRASVGHSACRNITRDEDVCIITHSR